MSAAVKTIGVIAFLACAIFAAPASADLAQVSAKGRWLAEQLDSLGVESRWIAGEHIFWRTGLPTGDPETLPGKHTHCSAFVAAAAEKLGVYILRPPQHKQALLANAQNEWLDSQGEARGWKPVASAEQAQSLANLGYLVVASYHNRRDDKPGHISIIRPAARTPAEIAAEGPLSIQAGAINSSQISVRQGFAGHVHAWMDDEIEYFAHETSGP